MRLCGDEPSAVQPVVDIAASVSTRP